MAIEFSEGNPNRPPHQRWVKVRRSERNNSMISMGEVPVFNGPRPKNPEPPLAADRKRLLEIAGINELTIDTSPPPERRVRKTA